MKKWELKEKVDRLQAELERERNDRHHAQRAKDRQLIRLGLIPDRYITAPELLLLLDSDEPVINWYRVENDLRDLETHEAAERGRLLATNEIALEINLDTRPFTGALKRYVEDCGPKPRKPWLDAKPGEVWEIDISGEEILCNTNADGDFTPISRHPRWAAIANDSNKITAGRRILIWRESEAEEPTETAVAYALAYRALQELLVAVNTKKGDGQ